MEQHIDSLRSKKSNSLLRQCDNCGIDYEPKWANQKRCSKKCSNLYYKKSLKQAKKNIRLETRLCKNCGNEFEWSSIKHNQKFCNNDCTKYFHKHIKEKMQDEIRNCLYCGSEFVWISTKPTQKFCSKKCGHDFRKEKILDDKSESSDIIYNDLYNDDEYPQCYIEDKFYVYGWYDDDVLFYVGKGIGKRYKSRHIRHDGSYAYCERVKLRSKNFKCLILRSGLSERESRLIESTLISVCKPFTNILEKSI